MEWFLGGWEWVHDKIPRHLHCAKFAWNSLQYLCTVPSSPELIWSSIPILNWKEYYYIESIPFSSHSAPFHPIPSLYHFIPFCSIPFQPYTISSLSVAFHPIPFLPIPFHSILFQYLHWIYRSLCNHSSSWTRKQSFINIQRLISSL